MKEAKMYREPSKEIINHESLNTKNLKDFYNLVSSVNKKIYNKAKIYLYDKEIKCKPFIIKADPKKYSANSNISIREVIEKRYYDDIFLLLGIYFCYNKYLIPRKILLEKEFNFYYFNRFLENKMQEIRSIQNSIEEDKKNIKDKNNKLQISLSSKLIK